MKPLVPSLLLVAFAMGSGAADRPNVIVLLTDDIARQLADLLTKYKAQPRSTPPS